jgi:hypothetical protein
MSLVQSFGVMLGRCHLPLAAYDLTAPREAVVAEAE